MLNKQDEQLLNLLDFKVFAPAYFKIRSKSGEIRSFKLNRAQNYLHNRLEDQRSTTGKVRAVILKGRQQGCSTYIQGRFSHRVLTSKGVKAYILTHEQEATNNLFDMTRRYIDGLPEGLAPKPDALASTKIHFKSLDSGYAVGTAGNKGAGRSQTIQLFHGSEVAFWPHAEEHAKGVMQAISRDNGTEIILESTANGIGNYFYSLWQSASGESEYQAIFLPWYWQDEYTNQFSGFQCTGEEQELIDQFGRDGLTTAHLSWRRIKIAEFSNDFEIGLERFKQEYPMTAAEAFRNPIQNVFIPSRLVLKARKNDIVTDSPLIIGVDVARGESDRNAIIRRAGRRAYNLEKFWCHNLMELCGKLKRVIIEEKPAKVYVDCIGIGAGVVDRMNEMGFDCVEGINTARSANDKEKFLNLRAELWSDMRDWLAQEMDVEIPDNDELQGELCSLGYKFKTSGGQLQIESKEDLRARGMPSPDGADSLALTYAGGWHLAANQIIVDKQYPHERGMFR